MGKRDILLKAENEGALSGKEFSLLMQELLVSPGGYVIDTGNWENVNAAVAVLLQERIQRHPILWRLFMVG